MKFDGGKAVVQRILQAYGFTMQKQLHDHLGVGNGTVSTWIKRNYFPGEVVIRCALETGADLEWLATGIPAKETRSGDKILPITIPRKKIANGVLTSEPDCLLDPSLFNPFPDGPLVVKKDKELYIVETNFLHILNGKWLIKRSDFYSISSVVVYPKKTVAIDGVQWPIEDLDFMGLVCYEIKDSLC